MNPGNIGRTHCAIRQSEPSGGTKNLAVAVSFRPNFEFRTQLTSTPAASSFRCHNKNISVRIALDLQITIELTELEELLVIHFNPRACMDDHPFWLNQCGFFDHMTNLPKESWNVKM